MKDYIRILIEKDRGHAVDNLMRARMAANTDNLMREWGESGQSLGQIIAEYEEWVALADAALAWLEKLP